MKMNKTNKEYFVVAQRGRPSKDNTAYEQKLEPRFDGISNTLTTVLKDNYIMEVTDLERIVCEQRIDEGLRFFKDDVCGTLRTINACGDKRIIEAEQINSGDGRTRVVNGNVRIRKLTPNECFKLMGFTEEDCKKCQENGISSSQLYKQAGNSIVVNVLEAIFTSLGNTYDEFKPKQ